MQTLRIREVAEPAVAPERLLVTLDPRRGPVALLSGPGAPELSRWSCVAFSPVGETDDLAVAARFARGVEIPESLPFAGPGTLPFLTGAVGYLTYDVGWRWAARPRSPRPHPLGLPPVAFRLYDAAYLFDHETGAACVVDRGGAAGDELLDAVRRRSPDPVGGLTAPLEPVIPRSEHEARVERARAAIADGEVYQVNLTHPLVGQFAGDPRAAFFRLAESPPPFAAYLGLAEDAAIVSGSPECFLTYRRADGRAQTYPIKGTRPRGRTPADDRARSDELLASEKDRAEHLMIVDLLRNDLGRIARVGGVKVDGAAYLESFPTVHHLTSRITAQLPPELDIDTLFAALFPGGSITGAPKLRAMEIIDALEGAPRGIYTGSIVALGPLGLVSSIAIRTAEIVAGQVRVGVGGGIVHDSDPADEYEESLVKARAISAALGSV